MHHIPTRKGAGFKKIKYNYLKCIITNSHYKNLPCAPSQAQTLGLYYGKPKRSLFYLIHLPADVNHTPFWRVSEVKLHALMLNKCGSKGICFNRMLICIWQLSPPHYFHSQWSWIAITKSLKRGSPHYTSTHFLGCWLRKCQPLFLYPNNIFLSRGPFTK